MRRDELAGEPARRGDRDLLAEDGAHRELEPVPRARHAQAGSRRDQRGEARVLGELRRDRGDVGAEVEDAPDAADDRGQRPDAPEADGHGERVAARGGRTSIVPWQPSSSMVRR